MSDDNEFKPMDVPHPMLAPRFEEAFLNQMDRSCELAFKGQLNSEKTNAILEALAKRWQTMDRFSKRELGETQSSSGAPRPPVRSTTVPQGQEATVLGPATVYGGKVEDVHPIPSDNA